MKRNIITKKELEYVQKYLPAMGDFQMRTDGGAWVVKVDNATRPIFIETPDGSAKTMLCTCKVK